MEDGRRVSRPSRARLDGAYRTLVALGVCGLGLLGLIGLGVRVMIASGSGCREFESFALRRVRRAESAKLKCLGNK